MGMNAETMGIKSKKNNGKYIAGVIGATGYAGAEIVRLLLGHPEVSLGPLSSVSFEGKALSEVYPAFYGICDQTLTNEDAVIAESDVVFASLPHGLAEGIAKKCLEQGTKLIDMGADFRLNEADYQEWYGGAFQEPSLHEQAVYCIPELHRARIQPDTAVIANPGCYVTCASLGLAPLMKAGLAETGSIVIDAKSGVTGAGRGLTQTTHFPDCNEGFAPYKAAVHRHTPEIEQNLSQLAGEPVKVTFVPHLLPVNRGIEASIYVTLKPNTMGTDFVELYRSFYVGEPFVKVLPQGRTANLKNVAYSNYCHISLHPDARTGRLMIDAVIDNMGKGAASQAIQNMNLLLGLPEGCGISAVPPAV